MSDTDRAFSAMFSVCSCKCLASVMSIAEFVKNLFNTAVLTKVYEV